jgi:hypothetical protein
LPFRFVYLIDLSSSALNTTITTASLKGKTRKEELGKNLQENGTAMFSNGNEACIMKKNCVIRVNEIFKTNREMRENIP